MDNPYPPMVPLFDGGDGAFAVAAGAAHTCVGATISASVLCFGLNVDGQLGGGTDPADAVRGRDAGRDAGDRGRVTAGAAHTCALDDGRRRLVLGARRRGPAR